MRDGDLVAERGEIERRGDIERSEYDLRSPDCERVRERPREALRERDGERESDGMIARLVWPLGISRMFSNTESWLQLTLCEVDDEAERVELSEMGSLSTSHSGIDHVMNTNWSHLTNRSASWLAICGKLPSCSRLHFKVIREIHSVFRKGRYGESH